MIQSPEDLKRAFEIREKVFVIEQEVAPEEEYDAFEDSSRHFLALLEGKAIGTARWRKTENGVKLERFAVLREARNAGAGSASWRQWCRMWPQRCRSARSACICTRSCRRCRSTRGMAFSQRGFIYRMRHRTL
ncbi:N-acetyltransferase GCN5 [Nitritalea halalkaliphila LW7]|uniref:N-acetyltransferase GCN5 n=1 Tax=Nitritalea halalkaliphila LW7 TaxID=1189621 RepID=I5BYB9_9BACT|nr:GNAT family N-acetyltransferase [Nitritalea halalkaliphila]EIM74571.1 N-acetyltransferase GCN5 [Nitritalea halalkaliphila LW7]